MKKAPNRWIILFAATLINLSLGTGYAWSVFQKPLLDLNSANGWTLPQTALAFSISFGMVPIGMIIFGPKVDSNDPRKIVLIGGILSGLGTFLTGFATSLPILYLTYGVLLGLGLGTAYGAATSVAVKWFPDKKGLAGGLAAAGLGSSPIIFSPIIRSTIAAVGVYRTFNILGVILLVLICSASVVMHKPPVPKPVEGAAPVIGKTYKEMLRESNFWILWLIFIMGATGGMMIIGTAADIATTYTLGDPVFVVMLVGVANTFGRIFWGAVSDKLGRNYTVIAMFAVIAIGLFLVASNQTVGATLGVIGLMMVALSFGGFLGAFPGITAENWGLKHAGMNYGWMFTAYGVAAIFGPQLGTQIKTMNNGDYTLSFFIVIGLAVIGALLQLYFIKKNKKTA